MSITNNAGNGFTANIKDYTTPKGANVYAYIWNLMREASSEITVHSDGGIFREISYQPQTVNHGASYTENSFWKVSVSVSPTKLEDKPWEAFKVSFGKESSTEVSYKTKSMDYSCKGQFGNGLYSKLYSRRVLRQGGSLCLRNESGIALDRRCTSDDTQLCDMGRLDPSPELFKSHQQQYEVASTAVHLLSRVGRTARSRFCGYHRRHRFTKDVCTL